MGRFINADALVSTGQGILGNNMFAYCNNNPVNLTDYCGNAPGDWFSTPDDAAEDFAEYINEQSIEENVEYASYIYAVDLMPKWLERLFMFLGMDEIVDEMSGKQLTHIRSQRKGHLIALQFQLTGLGWTMW